MAKRKRQKKMPRGKANRVADKIHGKKKGTEGEAAQYLTRAQALAKLQVTLADFRRLCILKGIYPRDPKKKAHGLDKTYYHGKDILFLAHEPLLNKFFELKTFMKKFKRLMGRNEHGLAASLEDRKPKYTLSHLVRERFPSFDDAVRDLDDAISMLALFQALSADQRREIPADAVSEATRLYQEFQLYVIRSRALRKVFASIKGYYFQAEVLGHPVTWLAPHQFAQELPAEVDFRVMLTFLEFYRAMVKFVNFRLYADLGLEYPPKRVQERDAMSAEVAALEVEMREQGEAREAQNQQDEAEDASVAAAVAADFGEQSEEAAKMQQQLAANSRAKSTFAGCHVFVSREVPLRPVYFTLLCGGAARVGWERGATAGGSAGAGSAFSVGSKDITHQIVDRPPDQLQRRTGREYVQPQWVFDSFNTGCQLLVAPYAPGHPPPPHLSPFVDDRAEGYVPRQRELLDRFAAAGAAAAATEEGGALPSGAAAPAAATAEGVAGAERSHFEQFSDELRAEASGVWHSAYQEQQKAAVAKAFEEATGTGVAAQEEAGAEGVRGKRRRRRAAAAREEAEEDDEAEDQVAEEEAMSADDNSPVAPPPPRPTEAEEERLRAKAMMPKKHKRLLQRIEKGKKKKADANASLLKKRRLLEGSEAATQ